MCGIWGIIPRTKNGLFKMDATEAKQMMLDTAKRGEHSTGLFMTEYKDPKALPTGVKVVGGPQNIVWNKDLWEEIGTFLQQKGGSVIGHGRQATRGKVSAKNAHPFQHDHITMVHNGTIYGGLSYAKQGETEVEVDSHALAVAMAERGVAEALTDIHGAYAVVVHDAKEGCLYFARNKDRPLHIFSSKDRHYIMSEFPYLWALVNSYNKSSDDDKVYILKEETLYKVDLTDPKEYVEVEDLKKLRLAKEEAKKQKEEAERKERAKQYQTSYGQVTTLGGKRGVMFKVTGIEKAPDGNYKYHAIATDKSYVWFMTDTEKLEYMNKEGKAKIHSAGYKGSMPYIFIKHRGIQWIDDIEEEEASSEATKVAEDDGGFFLTANNKRMSFNSWSKRIKHEGCMICDMTFRTWENKDVILTDDDQLLCVPCWKVFSGVPETTPLPTMN